MGSVASYLLGAGGCEVVLYEKREGRREEILSRGLVLRGELEGAREAAVLEPGTPQEPFDAIVLAVAGHETGEALGPLSPFVHRETVYLSLQEGFAADELHPLVGQERSFAAVAWVAAEESRGGEVWVEGFRRLVLGGAGARETAALRGLAEAMRSACAGGVELVEDVRPRIWERARAAAAVSALCAVLGKVPEEVRGLGAVEALADEAAAECQRLAAVTGVAVVEGASPWEEAVWKRTSPPMLRDVLSSRPTEIEYLGGRLSAIARRTGVKTPVQSALASLVREVEAGKRSPGVENLRELERRIGEEREMSLS